jgi:hypothetical protein
MAVCSLIHVVRCPCAMLPLSSALRPASPSRASVPLPLVSRGTRGGMAQKLLAPAPPASLRPPPLLCRFWRLSERPDARKAKGHWLLPSPVTRAAGTHAERDKEKKEH